jgi:serine/threonine protein kinase
MGSSEPGKRPQTPVIRPVGETRHAASETETDDNNKPTPAKADTVPADSGPGDGWTVAADPATTESRPSVRGERYVFGPELGRGGMGRVVEATDTRLGRKVAVKEALPRGLDLRRRFEREVRITARLEHPSIVPLYDAGTSPAGHPFYVMRKVSGRPLDKLIADAVDLNERLALLPHLLAAIDAIAHAHKRDVVHRDLKPANVLVGEHGETVVIDWGLAKALGEDDDDDDHAPVDDSLAPSDAVETQIGAVFGTPGFMAPEQARGEPLDPRSDVYALGATLYQLLSGRPPHSGTTATEVIDRALAERPPPLASLIPGVPPELVTITDKALAFYRDDRYVDAGALAEDVRRFTTGQLVAAHRYTKRQRITRFVRRHRAAVSIGALASIALVVGGTLSVRSIISERDRAMHAEQDANRARATAEQARDREADRADELLITQARALVEVNPTASLAALKLVKPRSHRLRHARMVAMSAVARGAAFGYPAHGRITSTLQLASDGRRLLSAGELHGFRIHDLDRREQVLAVEFPERIDATWIAGGTAVLVAPQSGGLIAFDATSGARTPIAAAQGRRARALGAAGDRVFFIDETDEGIHVLDTRTGAVTPFAVPGKHDDLVVAPDGSWLLAGGRAGVHVVRTADVRVLATVAGNGSWLAISPDGKRAALTADGRAHMLTIDGDRVTDVAIDPPRTKPVTNYPGQLLFRGDDLLVSRLASGSVDVHDAKGALQYSIKPSTHPLFGAVARGGMIAYGDMQGNLILVKGGSVREVRAPSEVQLKRVEARPDSRYIAVGTEGAILVWDLDRMTPMQLAVPETMNLIFRDDDTVLLAPVEEPWQLVDLRSGEVSKLEAVPPFASMTRAVVAPDRRILGEVMPLGLVLIRPDQPEIELVADGRVHGFALLSNNRFAYGATDGNLVLGSSRADRRVVLSGAGPPEVIQPAGDGLVALTAAGMLIRLDGAGRELARIQLDGQARSIAVDAGGQVVIALGNRVARWNGARVDDVVDLGTSVASIDTIPTGLVATTTAGDTIHITADGAAHRVLAVTQHGVRLSRRSGMLLSTLGGGELVVVDLQSNERTVLPEFGVQAMPVISEDGRRIVYADRGRLSMWTLDAPSGPDGWTEWLTEQTNAEPSLDPDVSWPWPEARAQP